MFFSSTSCRTSSLWVSFVVVAALFSGGCQLMTSSADLSSLPQNPGALEAAPISVSTYSVEIRHDSGESEIAEFSVEEAGWMSDAVVLSGATHRFRHLKGFIVRTTDDGNQVRMKSEWDRAHSAFSVQTDFALHPGDQVVFTEDTTTSFDNLVETLLGNL